MLIIDNIEFIIDKCCFSAYIDSNCNLLWDFDIRTKENFDLEYGNIFRAREIKLYGDSLPLKIKSLAKLPGSTIKVKEAFDSETDEPLFSLYVYEHEEVCDSKIIFSENIKNKFKIKWTLIGFVMGKKYNIEINDWIEFKELLCDVANIDIALLFIGKHFNCSEFTFKEKNNNGFVFIFDDKATNP